MPEMNEGSKVCVKDWPWPGWNGRVGTVLEILCTGARKIQFDDWQKIVAIFAPENLEAK